MTPEWSSVVADAIKIVAPAFLVAGASIGAVYINRSTELRKDARRRRQDAIEEVSDLFQSGHSAYTDLVIAFSTLISMSGGPGEADAREHLARCFKRIEEIMESLFRMEGRARLLGLDDCDHAFEEYTLAVMELKSVIKHRSPYEMGTLQKKYDAIRARRSDVHRELQKAYSRI
jgi:hypothetical protein